MPALFQPWAGLSMQRKASRQGPSLRSHLFLKRLAASWEQGPKDECFPSLISLLILFSIPELILIRNVPTAQEMAGGGRGGRRAPALQCAPPGAESRVRCMRHLSGVQNLRGCSQTQQSWEVLF